MSSDGRQLLIAVVKGHRRVERVMEGFLEQSPPGMIMFFLDEDLVALHGRPFEARVSFLLCNNGTLEKKGLLKP